MNMLVQSAFLKALGWSLLDSMWQMGVLWILYLLLTNNGKRFQPARRHLLALLSLAGGALWFVVNISIRFYKAVDTALIETTGTSETSSFALFQSIQDFFEPALPYLSIVYLVITLVLFLKLYRQFRDTKSLFKNGISKADPELRIFVQQLAYRMGIRREVKILLSKLVDSPMTLGFWKPVILLPIAAINQLSVKQTEAILLHELHHIQRNDYFINLLIACTEVLLFFNPFVRIFSDIIRKEREHCCDDLVMQFNYDPANYAQALLKLELYRAQPNPFAIAATGRNKQMLLNRVKRILTKENVSTPVSHRLLACFLAVIMIAGIGWYNPGRALVKTVAAMNETMFTPVSAEQPLTFATPANDANEIVPDKKKSPAKELESVQVRLAVAKDEEQTDDQTDLADEEDVMEPFLSFVGQEEARDFSIPQSKVPTPPTPLYPAEHPYVPSNSFSIQFVEDTAMPKKYVPSQSEVKAKESLEKTLLALEELDWTKLEKEINGSGKKVDIAKLQEEIRKAMAEIDWKKINEDVQNGLAEASEEILKTNEALRNQLKNFQKERSVRQDKARKTQEIILLDRLQSTERNGQKPKAALTPQTDSLPKKKVVII